MMNIPTQQSVGHNSHAKSIDDFNREMRSQPWYQDWFRQRGLDSNRVHLSQQQRRELEGVIVARGGVPHDAFNDMMIDPAGNLNTEHGFASQPTWLKAVEIGAPIAAADYFSGGALHAPIQGLLTGGGAAPGFSASVGAPAATEASIFGGAGPAAALTAAGGGAVAASRIPWGTIARVGGTVAAPAIARTIAGSGGSNNGSGSGTGMDLPPELKQLLQMQLQRIQASQPNYDLMLNMARGLQPQWARNSAPQDPQMAAIIQRLAQPRG